MKAIGSMSRWLRGGSLVALLAGALALSGCAASDGGTDPEGGAPGEAMEAGALYVDEVSAATAEGDTITMTLVGNYPESCSVMGEARAVVEGDTITVEAASAKPADEMCAQQLTPFEETLTIQLDDALVAGDYALVVNDVATSLTVE